MGNKKKPSAKSGKQIPQLGEQKNQSVPPLIVTSNSGEAFRAEMDKDWELLDPRFVNAAREQGVTVQEAKESATSVGISLAQMLGLDDTPMGPLARKYVKREPLVTPEEEKSLPTNMRQLHDWYKDHIKNKNCKEYITADVREEHHFKRYGIHIQLDELFQLFNGRELDKSIIG